MSRNGKSGEAGGRGGVDICGGDVAFAIELAAMCGSTDEFAGWLIV